MTETATQIRTALPGTLTLRPAPSGLPAADLQPPTIAESGDPFATARILHLVARIDRGRRAHLDWIFDRRVVADAILALQANWRTDYRTTTGIILDDSPYGPTVTVEDSSRVDPWIVRQVAREVTACEAALRDFSRLDRVTGDA